MHKKRCVVERVIFYLILFSTIFTHYEKKCEEDLREAELQEERGDHSYYWKETEYW